MKLNMQKAGDKLFGAVGMVLIALLIGGVLVVISGNNMLEAYGSLISGASVVFLGCSVLSGLVMNCIAGLIFSPPMLSLKVFLAIVLHLL